VNLIVGRRASSSRARAAGKATAARIHSPVAHTGPTGIHVNHLGHAGGSLVAALAARPPVPNTAASTEAKGTDRAWINRRKYLRPAARKARAPTRMTTAAGSATFSIGTSHSGNAPGFSAATTAAMVKPPYVITALNNAPTPLRPRHPVTRNPHLSDRDDYVDAVSANEVLAFGVEGGPG
jgi:hypothetical protein